MRKLSLPRWIKRNPVHVFGLSVIMALATSLLLYRINTLHPGPNTYELVSIERLGVFNTIIKQPLDIFYYSLARLLSFLFSSLTALRLSSAAFALITLLNFRFVIKYWLNTRTANIGTLVLASSFWFILIGRIGAPFVMPAFWISTIMALTALLKYTKYPKLVTTAAILSIGFGLYTPLFLWLLLPTGILAIREWGAKQILNKIGKIQLLIVLALIIHIIYSCIINPAVIRELLGYNSFNINPLNYIATVTKYISLITLRGVLDPSVNLGRLPLLDIMQLVMLCIGVSVLYPINKSLKSYLLIVLPIVYILLISFSAVETTKLVALIPIIFIVIAAGLNEFIQLWLKSFPKNPIGRSIGVLMCVGLIAGSGYYNVNRYYTAWANNPEAQAAHQLQ